MSRFDSFAIVDWSGGNDTGPKPRKDAIWLGLVRAGKAEAPRYLRNRVLAEAAIAELIEDELCTGRRLCIGFDFPFGYPAGFARALTGQADPFAVWDWIEERLYDTPKANSRFDLAAEINSRFAGIGPFWFNGLQRDIAHLPRKDIRAGHGVPERRVAEVAAKGAFTCWQMGGAGTVGGQVLTGLPVLNRLRRRFAGQVAVWPFETLDLSVSLVEIWPGLINTAVKRAEAQGGLRDAHQVRLLALALSRLHPDDLDAMLEIYAPEEGWIMGLGHEDKLTAATQERLAPPPLRDDCFALPAGVDWTPVEDALELLRDRLHPVVAHETVPVGEVLGRVLAAPVVAKRANPPEPNTAVDGYGFAHASIGSGEVQLPLVAGRSAAGVPYDGSVPPGHAIRVLTGAALPKGVDTVILQEDVTASDSAIAFRAGLRAGANTRKAGEDVRTGDTVLEPGRILTPADLGLISAIGVDRVEAYVPLKVAILSTGDELRNPGQKVSPGQIYDANRPMLSGLVQQLGFVPVDIGIQPDDRNQLRAALDRAAEQADVILTSGGASAGDEDHVSALLNEAGAMAEWRIALKPGRPLALGIWNETPVFGLPGNPVAALVCTLIFGAPAMRLLSGAGWRMPQGFSLPAAFSKSKKPGRREYLRARVRNGQAEVFASEGSGRISGLSWAEGLVELAEPRAEINQGDPVWYIPFTSF
jgi:molybdopterin molybdotransferase